MTWTSRLALDCELFELRSIIYRLPFKYIKDTIYLVYLERDCFYSSNFFNNSDRQIIPYNCTQIFKTTQNCMTLTFFWSVAVSQTQMSNDEIFVSYTRETCYLFSVLLQWPSQESNQSKVLISALTLIVLLGPECIISWHTLATSSQISITVNLFTQYAKRRWTVHPLGDLTALTNVWQISTNNAEINIERISNAL